MIFRPPVVDPADPPMKNNRKICVVTGSRAEYGLLYWLMKEINMAMVVGFLDIIYGKENCWNTN